MRRKKWNNYVAKWSVLPCPIHECDTVLFFFRYDWDRVIIIIGIVAMKHQKCFMWCSHIGYNSPLVRMTVSLGRDTHLRPNNKYAFRLFNLDGSIALSRIQIMRIMPLSISFRKTNICISHPPSFQPQLT